MCGIFALRSDAPEVIARSLKWLQALEYRWYDSAGICAMSSADFFIEKSVGRVSALGEKVARHGGEFTTAITHTRWATHGRVTEHNSHPHLSSDGRFALVHNGIIENYNELKSELTQTWVSFVSETDTEVAVNVFAQNFDGEHFSSLKKASDVLQGSFAFVFVDRKKPSMLFGMKRKSPLLIGKSWEDFIVSSDLSAFPTTTEKYIVLGDDDKYVIDGNNCHIIRSDASYRDDWKSYTVIVHSEIDGSFPHQMLAEIYEQPRRIAHLIHTYSDTSSAAWSPLRSFLAEHFPTGIQRIQIIASGTSYHAGLMGRLYFEEMANIPTEVFVSAEFRHRRPFVTADTLFIFVSQSGETADTIDCLRMVKQSWAKVMSLVNVEHSAMAQEADFALFTQAGVEVGVASTKAFTTQTMMLLLFARLLSGESHIPTAHLESLPHLLSQVLASSEKIAEIARTCTTAPNWFYLARHFLLPIAQEGSLKLKELTYHHSEAYSAGELKHGSIALIEEGFPCVMIDTVAELSHKNHSSAQEVKSRGGKVIGLVTSETAGSVYDEQIVLPIVSRELAPFTAVIALQLFAYHITVALGNDVDKPRNLAKSVTVE